jgi:uncharacterized caspase-like protein
LLDGNSIAKGTFEITPSSVQIQVRRALVIGNAGYSDIAPLPSSYNDAFDMAATLNQLGFAVMEPVYNANQRQMEDAIKAFTDSAPPGSVGLFYFSGHGVQVDNVNYLLPVGQEFRGPSDVKFGAINANWVLGRMNDSQMAVKLLILDACRTNSPSWNKDFRFIGLAPMDSPAGSLIAYATSPGKAAAAGQGGRNSIFTRYLLREMRKSNRPIQLTFEAIRGAVLRETNNQQTPTIIDATTGTFSFAQ